MARSEGAAERADAAIDRAGPLALGARFLDKYEIREQIGRGGQAWVYHGQHIFTGREVAIKIVHSARGMTRELLERGKSEARALGKLDHPNVVIMHDAGVTDDGLFYIVMELLRGRSLRAALAAEGPLSVDVVLHLAAQTAEAVQAAHDLALVHRDLTPDNIFLTLDDRVKVLDFGIAKMLNEIGFTTHKDIVMGSILYMSPEQVQGLPLGPPSDICALGILMFEMLLGKHPSLLLFEQDLRRRGEAYRRPTLAEIPPIQVNRVPPLLSELDPSIAPQLAQVVHRAMARNPEHRFATMLDLLSAIRACDQASCPSAPRTRRAAGRDPWLPLEVRSEKPPPSERGTPRRGSIWDGAGSRSAVPPALELLAVTTAITGTAAARAGGRSEPPRARARFRSLASVRNGLLLACLFGAALGSLGALGHFALRNPAPELEVEVDMEGALPASANAVLASHPPALAGAVPEREQGVTVDPSDALPSAIAIQPHVASPAVAPSASPHDATRSAPLRHLPPATESAAGSSFAEMTDVSRPLAIDLSGKQRTRQAAPSAEVRRKKLNGGKLIYGD